VLLQHFQFRLSKDTGLQLDALSKGLFLLKDPKGRKLGSYPRNYSLIDLHDDALLGGERIEQLRTIVSRIRAFISIISKILLKVPLLNSRNLEERALRANPTSRFTYGALFLIFLETISRGRLRKEWLKEKDHYDSSISTTILWKRYYKKAHLVPVSGRYLDNRPPHS
jgi:hypothetical protein